MPSGSPNRFGTSLSSHLGIFVLSMLKPSYRGLSGTHGRPSDGNFGEESFDKGYLQKNFTKNGFVHELPSPFGNVRNRQCLTLSLLKQGLVLISFAALCGSLCWIAYMSTASQINIYPGYRRLQERLIADLSVVGELSRGVGKLKELEFCPPEYENYVPCYYNVSEKFDSTEDDGQIEYQRQCVQGLAKGLSCLVLPPRNYRIPLRWPTGRDFIWKDNIKISGWEFSSGSLTKRFLFSYPSFSVLRNDHLYFAVVDYEFHILAKQMNFVLQDDGGGRAYLFSL